MDLKEEDSELIYTDDLNYSSDDGSYSYQFSYLGDGVFVIKSKGYIRDHSLKRQFASGDIARKRLIAVSNKKYNLVWDVSEVKGVSLLSRQMILSKISSDGTFESVTIIAANKFIRFFGIVVSKFALKVKFFFFSTYDDAIQNLQKNLHKYVPSKPTKNVFLTNDSESYSRFIEIWQNNPEYITFEGNPYKTIASIKWQYGNHTFKIKANVIEGNIVYIECIGALRSEEIDACYGILEDIMHELGFNATINKFYTILNAQKVSRLTLGAKRRMSYYEQLYKKRSIFVVAIASPIMLFLVRMFRKTNLESFSHWETSDSLENALKKIFLHRKKSVNEPELPYLPLQDMPPLIIPSEPKEMTNLIKKQYNEIFELKKQQQENILKIIDITGRMTWDESFIAPTINPDVHSPFNEIYNSLTILFQDFQDVIQEKQIHTEKLQESEDKYRNLLNLANDIILVYQDNVIQFVNPKVKQVLDFSPEVLIGKTLDKIVASEEILKLKELHSGILIGEEVSLYETAFIHRNGSKIPISMSIGNIIYEKRPAQMIIARDITERKYAEEELEQYRNHLEEIIIQRTLQLQKETSERKIAEESDRLKSAFLSNMSHEIRTPMNAIISFTKFLKSPDLSQNDRDEYLNYIQSSGQLLLNLINDIIDISKIEAKQLTIHESSCDVQSLLRELHKLFDETRKINQKNKISLSLDIPDDSPLILNTDPYRLRQILSNLLDNAFKFTDEGQISLGYTISKSFVSFFVKDTGIGIPDDKKNYIFKRFGKIESLGRNISGTGLGLAISKQLSILLRGKIWVESKEGEGSCFYLKLPLSSANEALPSKTTVQSSGPLNWSGKKILIAEDEELNFKVLQISLRNTGAEIIRASNGKEALDMILQDPDIDLVLMDIQMPVIDGYTAMERIKNIRPDLPVIAQTAFAMVEEQKKCMDMGFTNYISKPINIDDLLAKIQMEFS